jgi:hypothetical protein
MGNSSTGPARKRLLTKKPLQYVHMHRVNGVPPPAPMTAHQWATLAVYAVAIVALGIVALDLVFWRP